MSDDLSGKGWTVARDLNNGFPVTCERVLVIEKMSTRIEELEAELHLMKTAGIIEVAVRNPSVSEYMAHWEGRAEKAEAKLAKAVECLKDWQNTGCPYCNGDCSSANPTMSYCIVQKTYHTLAELKGQDDE